MKRSLATNFAFICLLGFTTLSSAQNLSIGVSASFDYNAYWFVNDQEHIEYFKYKGRPGYTLGVLVRKQIGSKVFLKSGIGYSAKNYSELVDYRSIDPNDPQLTSSGPFKIKFSSQFIELPLDISYQVGSGEKGKTYFLLGLINSFRVGYSAKKESSPFLQSEIRYNKYLLAAKAGIGMLFDFKESNILIEPQLRYYLTEVHENYPSKDPFYLGIEISYFLPIKKAE